MPTDRRPNLFIVGAQKSGTSALAGWLQQHPSVFMSFPKEPGFLAFGEAGYTFPDGYGKAPPAAGYVVTDAASYESLFAGATADNTVIGEASTWYFALPGMAETLRRYNPSAKIVVVLRNPVDRAYSAWCDARGSGLEPCADFADAWRAEAERGEVEFLLRYSRMGMYSAALEAYRAAFPAAQLLVLWHEDMRNAPEAFWRQVCEFLAIDPGHTPIFSHKYNPSGSPRFKTLSMLLRSHRLKQFLKPLLPYKLSLRIKGRLDAANLRDFPPMSEQMRGVLQQHYRDDIRRLEALTGRDLSGWLA